MDNFLYLSLNSMYVWYNYKLKLIQISAPESVEVKGDCNAADSSCFRTDVDSRSLESPEQFDAVTPNIICAENGRIEQFEQANDKVEIKIIYAMQKKCLQNNHSKPIIYLIFRRKYLLMYPH